MSDITLKPVNADLIAQIPAWFTSPEPREYFRNYPPLHEWNRPDLIAQKLDWAYGIYENEQLIGLVQLFLANTVAKTVELGMLIDNSKTLDRKRAAFETHKQIVNYLFNDLGYQKIYMRVLSHRESLLKRLQEFGYVIEGKFHKSTKLDGIYRDECYLALFKGE